MTTTRAPRDGRRAGSWILVAVAVLLGAVLVVIGLATQQPAAPALAGPVGALPQPAQPQQPAQQQPAQQQRAQQQPGGRQDSSPEVTPAAKVPVGASEPTSISIPAIGVDSAVFSIGKADDGTLAVPQPGPDLDKAAWFENSPTPGQPGPSIIEGHVSTDQGGPSIFFDLAELRPGHKIVVTRKDGSTVVFEVTALREFAKDQFPTELVYGGDLSTPTLRLITCSSFDPSLGNHTSNLIVFTQLTRVLRG